MRRVRLHPKTLIKTRWTSLIRSLIWLPSCTTPTPSQDLFLERGGIPILLSLLEKCPPSMQNLVLGALLDLTEDPRAVSHVVTWRGLGQITAVSLLVNLWRQEEAAMGVKRDPNNIMIG